MELGADRDLGAAAARLVQVEGLDLNFVEPISKGGGQASNRRAHKWQGQRRWRRHPVPSRAPKRFPLVHRPDWNGGLGSVPAV